jgi:hypothetical protein
VNKLPSPSAPRPRPSEQVAQDGEGPGVSNGGQPREARNPGGEGMAAYPALSHRTTPSGVSAMRQEVLRRGGTSAAKLVAGQGGTTRYSRREQLDILRLKQTATPLVSVRPVFESEDPEMLRRFDEAVAEPVGSVHSPRASRGRSVPHPSSLILRGRDGAAPHFATGVSTPNSQARGPKPKAQRLPGLLAGGRRVYSRAAPGTETPGTYLLLFELLRLLVGLHERARAGAAAADEGGRGR